MTPAVVSASCHPPKAGAVLGVTNGCLLPMAPWVALGRGWALSGVPFVFYCRPYSIDASQRVVQVEPPAREWCACVVSIGGGVLAKAGWRAVGGGPQG